MTVRTVLAALSLLAAACAGPPEERFFLGGIQVNEADHGQWVENLERAGMNTVAVTVYAHQGDWDTDHMWYDQEAPWVVHEIRLAKQAGLHVAFIPRVALDHAFPRNQFLWHGMIMPRSEEQLASWFAAYTRFLRHWGAVAEAEGVDLYAVGSELNALASTVPVEAVPALEEYFLNPEKQARYKEQVLAQADAVAPQHLTDHGAEGYQSLADYLDARTSTNRDWAASVAGEGREADVAAMNRRRGLLAEHWRRTIAAVREVYSGPLLYAANFDQYQEVGFWPELDLVGINAYFPLRPEDSDLDLDDPGALSEALVAGWRGILGRLAEFRRERGIADRPVVFTELGYTHRKNSTIHPWAGDGFSLVGRDGERRVVVWKEQPVDPTERALAVRALRQAAEELGEDLLRGILYWKLTSHDYHREVEPFALVIGDGSDDPLLAELARLRRLPERVRRAD